MCHFQNEVELLSLSYLSENNVNIIFKIHYFAVYTIYAGHNLHQNSDFFSVPHLWKPSKASKENNVYSDLNIDIKVTILSKKNIWLSLVY